MRIGNATLIVAGSLVLVLGAAGAAVAQNSTGQFTPLPTHTPAPAMPPPMLKPGGDLHNWGTGHHHGHHEFPVFVTPFFSGFVDDNNMEVQSTPVNPQPFAPAESPPPGSRPVVPYKPPSVEVAPGGIEIVRGPGQ